VEDFGFVIQLGVATRRRVRWSFMRITEWGFQVAAKIIMGSSRNSAEEGMKSQEKG
jgi:hypothetical protein